MAPLRDPREHHSPREHHGPWPRRVALTLSAIVLLVLGGQLGGGAASSPQQTGNSILRGAVGGFGSGACELSTVRTIATGNTVMTQLKGAGWLRTDSVEGYQKSTDDRSKAVEEVRRFGESVFGRRSADGAWTRWPARGDGKSPEVTAPGADPVLYTDLFRYLSRHWQSLKVQPTLQKTAGSELPALQVDLRWDDIGRESGADAGTWSTLGSYAGHHPLSLLVMQSASQTVLYFSLPAGAPAEGAGNAPDSLRSGLHIDATIGCRWMPRASYAAMPEPAVGPRS